MIRIADERSTTHEAMLFDGWGFVPLPSSAAPPAERGQGQVRRDEQVDLEHRPQLAE